MTPKYVAFFMTIGFLSLPARAALTCAPQGNIIVIQYNGQSLQGEPSSYGFNDVATCKQSVHAAKNDFVCYWNGANYQPMDASNSRFIGEKGFGFDTLEACVVNTSGSSADAVCNWSRAKGYSTYSRASNIIGPDAHGFGSESECISSIKNATNGVYCEWNGTDFTLYRADKSEQYGVFHFSTQDSCMAFNKKIQQPVDLLPNSSSLQQALTPFKQQINESVGFTWSNCRDPNQNSRLIMADGHGNILPECVPDVLYSWGPSEKLIWWQANVGTHHPWIKRLNRPLYATQSPVATFGYGPIPMRIKLKDNLKVKLFTPQMANFSTDGTMLCSRLSAAEATDTLIIRYWSSNDRNGVDYILCSTEPIASWSFGQQQHFDEIVDDALWVSSHKDTDYELYYKVGAHDDLFSIGNLDGHAFTEDQLSENLTWMHQSIELNQGEIYYNDGVATDPGKHFHTNHPIYYNAN